VDCETFGLSGAAVYNAERWMEHWRRSGGAERRSAISLRLEVEFANERVTVENPVPRPLKEAIVTIGGVSTEDVDPATMESRKVPGLFFAGEVLDIDGPTGGYNLSLAFATAHLAVSTIVSRRT
jgi:hypothetical protein